MTGESVMATGFWSTSTMTSRAGSVEITTSPLRPYIQYPAPAAPASSSKRIAATRPRRLCFCGLFCCVEPTSRVGGRLSGGGGITEGGGPELGLALGGPDGRTGG